MHSVVAAFVCVDLDTHNFITCVLFVFACALVLVECVPQRVFTVIFHLAKNMLGGHFISIRIVFVCVDGKKV